MRTAMRQRAGIQAKQRARITPALLALRMKRTVWQAGPSGTPM